MGLRTSDHVTIIDGGIWKDEVALHITIGQNGIGKELLKKKNIRRKE